MRAVAPEADIGPLWSGTERHDAHGGGGSVAGLWAAPLARLPRRWQTGDAAPGPLGAPDGSREPIALTAGSRETGQPSAALDA